jgi:hypothetical protein
LAVAAHADQDDDRRRVPRRVVRARRARGPRAG